LQITDLIGLHKKYQDLIVSYQNQIQDATRKMKVVEDAINLLEKEGILEQTELFEPQVVVLSDKYSKMTLPEAIKDLLDSGDSKTSEQIYDELMKNGFQSGSKNFKSDLRTRLYNLSKVGEIVSIKEGEKKKKNKYSLPNKTMVKK
jgi:hypothetical protein